MALRKKLANEKTLIVFGCLISLLFNASNAARSTPFSGMQVPIQGLPYSDKPDMSLPKRQPDKPATWYSVVWTGKYWGPDSERGEGSGKHPGVDIRVDTGTKVYAIADGEVWKSYFDREWGNIIITKHTLPNHEPIWSTYAHLSKRYVNKGKDINNFAPKTVVKKGDVVGESGDTGSTSKGAHLHFQIDRDKDVATGKTFISPYYPPGNTEAPDTNDNVKNHTYNPIPFIAVWNRYYALGGSTSFLGKPIGDISNTEKSRFGTKFKYQSFKRGALEFHQSGPFSGKAFETHGAIFEKWKSLGYAKSVLGLVTSDEREARPSPFETTGRVSDFESGHIHRHRNGKFANQAFETHGEIDKLYVSMGGSASWLGFPLSDEFRDSSGYPQTNFEGGYITTTDGTNYRAFRGPEGSSAPAAEIKLKDKSIIKGEIQQEKIKIETKYGEINIPVENFVSIIGALIKLRDGTTLRGSFADKVLSVKTDYAELKVQTKEIDFIIFGEEESPPEIEGPLPEFHGVYLVSKGELIELKPIKPTIAYKDKQGLTGPKRVIESLPRVNIENSKPEIIVYGKKYSQRLEFNVPLLWRFEYAPKGTFWKPGPDAWTYWNFKPGDVDMWVESGAVEVKTKPVEGKTDMYRLIPATPLSPGVYAVHTIPFTQQHTFFTVNHERHKGDLIIQAKKHYQLGMSYFAKDRYDEAIEEFKKVIRGQPDNPDAHYYLAQCYNRTLRFDESIEELKKAIQIRPNDFSLHQMLGSSYIIKKRYDSAIEEFKKAIQIQPDNADGYHWLGLSYYYKKMYDEAIVELKKALQKANYSARATHRTLGCCYYEKKMYDEAIVELKKALRDTPTYTDYLLGRCYYEKKMYDKAIAVVTRYLELLKTEKGSERFQKEVEEFLRKLEAEKIQKVPKVEEKVQETAKKEEAKMPHVMARVSNADDKAVMYVNGQEAISIAWGTGSGGKSIGHRPGDSGWIDITPYLKIRDNILRFWVWNKAVYGAVSGTFEVRINGVPTISRSFKKQDSTAGVKYDETVIFSLPEPVLKPLEAEKPKKIEQQIKTIEVLVPPVEEGVVVPIKIQKGQLLTISATEKVDIGRGPVGPNGHPGYVDHTMDSPYKHNVGGLEMWIGPDKNANRYFVGSYFSQRVKHSGDSITLRVIESLYGYHDANTGAFKATIKVTD